MFRIIIIPKSQTQRNNVFNNYHIDLQQLQPIKRYNKREEHKECLHLNPDLIFSKFTRRVQSSCLIDIGKVCDKHYIYLFYFVSKNIFLFSRHEDDKWLFS